MKITIRTRTLRTGSRSIYLDFYDKGKRWNEYLNLFLVPDDEPDAKRLNEAVMAKANAIKSKRRKQKIPTIQRPQRICANSTFAFLFAFARTSKSIRQSTFPASKIPLSAKTDCTQ